MTSSARSARVLKTPAAVLPCGSLRARQQDSARGNARIRACLATLYADGEAAVAKRQRECLCGARERSLHDLYYGGSFPRPQIGRDYPLNLSI